MRLSHLLIAIAFLLGLSSPALAEPDFLNNGMQMTTTLCGEAGSYSCTTSDSSAVIDAANQCVMTYHDIKERIMTDFVTRCARANCVLPNKMYTDPSGTNSWSICCVRPVSEGGDDCSLYCTRFISNKK